MLLCPLPALLNHFPRTFIIKGSANNRRNPPSCPSALTTPFPVITFINEQATDFINDGAIGATNEAAIGTIIARRNLPA